MKKMPILYVGNNKNGYKILKWLIDRGEKIVAVGVHGKDRAKFRDEMISLCSEDIFIFDDDVLLDSRTISQIRSIAPHLLVSVSYGRIIPREILNIPSGGCINLHPSFLPHNRGSFPNVWPILDGTPAGVTMHMLDPGVDTGDIIAQTMIDVMPNDTGASLYERLEESAFQLFIDTWEPFVMGEIQPFSQSENLATCHKISDVNEIDEIKLDGMYSARALIDLLRARTFSPYNGAYFYINGTKYYLELNIRLEDQDHE